LIDATTQEAIKDLLHVKKVRVPKHAVDVPQRGPYAARPAAGAKYTDGINDTEDDTHDPDTTDEKVAPA